MASAAPDTVRERIAAARGFIFDMDGTIALGDRSSGGHRALPGAIELLAWLGHRGIPFQVFTNGTAKPPSHYAASLRKAGFDIEDSQMMTPATSAADYFVAKRIGRVRVLGIEGAIQPLEEAGITVIGPAAKGEVDAVFTAWYREFTYPDLEAACNDVWAGAGLTTASHVPFFASETGRAIGSSFAINVMISSLTKKRARVLGKPSRQAFASAMHRLGLPSSAASGIVVVGDDPALEMRMANEAGAVSVGVATGLQTLESLSELGDKERPALAIGGVDALLDLI